MTPETSTPVLWTPAQTAEYLHTTEESLKVRRYRRSGPPFIRAGHRVLYRAQDVLDWLEEGAA
ncbi:DNA-binding protein [Dietzia cercidiphylli]|uniref:DNA-binding protein n=1 Tax=Dietzia cercidiphylli TaxID=498199 RepID=UPI00223B0873|nr:DNA-binding protein [Dietzia cercidiphylli]MCT1516583.1 DNA-binding protein [Dietzia cercidiphylli]